MIQRALIIDTETSGLDASASIVEIGAILYSVTNQTTLQEMATLLPAESNEAESINRIKPAALEEILSTGTADALALLVHMAMSAEVYIAHNAEFDAAQLASWNGLLPARPWLCTMSDFKWPLATRERGSIVGLALDHGIGVSSAHRALTDCRLIAALFDRMTDLQGMFQIAMRPKGLFQALVSYDDRELAKQAGFGWNGQDKTWTRTMAIEDAEALSFRVRQI